MKRATIKVDEKTLQTLKAEQGRRMLRSGETWSMDRLISALLKETYLLKLALRRKES